MLNSCSYKNETVCVIGGGWYGCHMAATLSNLGYDVELLEKNNVLFGESSSKNQCRLHRGLHYVRSWNTRKECMEGYTQLTKRYPMCVSPVEKNYYVVSQKSPIDFNTILDILTASNIPHTRVKPVDGQLSSFQGVIECDEQMFDHTLGAEHFANLLGGMVQYGVHVDDVVSDGDKVCVKTNNGKKEYGFAIDCTYNALGKAQKFIPCFYEPCLTLLYKYIGPDSTHPAVTVIDGEFVSLYPYAGATGKEFTLTSVADTPLGNYNTWAECEDRIKSVGFLELEEKKTKFEAMICKYVPNFKQNFGSVY